MNCLKNIVTIKDLCGESVPTSGYDLMSAPEISPKQSAAIANEEYVKGLDLLKAKLDMAILEVGNDFNALISTNGYALNVAGDTYSSGTWNSGINNPPAALERGLILHKANYSPLKRIRITNIQISVAVSMNDVPVYIYDNGLKHTYYFNLVAGSINIFAVNHLMEGSSVRVVMDNSVLTTSSTVIACKLGCGGTVPNPCGYVKGWNGSQEIQSESFGLHINFNCECVTESIVCDLASSFTGKLIWLKARLLVMEEHLYSTRLNSIVLWGKDKIEKLKSDVEKDYVETWNSLVNSLPVVLKKYQGECIVCNGIKIVTNV